jgi:hypothetical protein
MTVDGVLRKNGSTSRSWEADLMQVAYLLELICRYRLEAEMARAKLYVNIHKLIVAGNRARADDLRRLIPATEAGVVTLDLLGEALRDRIIAVTSSVRPPSHRDPHAAPSTPAQQLSGPRRKA